MNRTIPVSALGIGMFVAELDRSWLGTPFLFQGEFVESEEDLARYRELCTTVAIDVRRSRVLPPEDAPPPPPLSPLNELRALKSAQPEAEEDDGSAAPIDESARLLSRLPLRSHFSSTTFGDIPRRRYVDTVPVHKEMAAAKVAHQQASGMLDRLLGTLRSDGILEMASVEEAVGSLVDSIERNPHALVWLTRMQSRDNYLFDHALEASVYMMTLARHLGFPREDLARLGQGALLLDIGKLELDPVLLSKPAELTPPERSVVRSHVKRGLDQLLKTENVPREALEMVAAHHERLDGRGYPIGLSGDDLGLYAQMAGLVDSFVAMITARPYAQQRSVQAVVGELYKLRDRSFSAALIEQFIQCIGVFPIGSIVELNSKEIAIVATRNARRRFKPNVLIVRDTEHKPIRQPRLIDLMNEPKTPQGEIYRIQRALDPGAFGIEPEKYYLWPET